MFCNDSSASQVFSCKFIAQVTSFFIWCKTQSSHDCSGPIIFLISPYRCNLKKWLLTARVSFLCCAALLVWTAQHCRMAPAFSVFTKLVYVFFWLQCKKMSWIIKINCQVISMVRNKIIKCCSTQHLVQSVDVAKRLCSHHFCTKAKVRTNFRQVPFQSITLKFSQANCY